MIHFVSNTMARKHARMAVILVVACSLAACSPFSRVQKEPSRLFTLDARGAVETRATAVPVLLRVNIPQAAPGLQSDRIAIHRGGQEMDYYAGAKWSGSLPEVVQAALVSAYQDAGAVTAVGNDVLQFRPDYFLSLDIADFEAMYQEGADLPIVSGKKDADKNAKAVAAVAAPQVDVRIVAHLTDRENKLIATRTYTRTVPAAQHTQESVMAAFNDAFRMIAADIIVTMTEAMPEANGAQRVSSESVPVSP